MKNAMVGSQAVGSVGWAPVRADPAKRLILRETKLSICISPTCGTAYALGLSEAADAGCFLLLGRALSRSPGAPRSWLPSSNLARMSSNSFTGNMHSICQRRSIPHRMSHANCFIYGGLEGESGKPTERACRTLNKSLFSLLLSFDLSLLPLLSCFSALFAMQ